MPYLVYAFCVSVFVAQTVLLIHFFLLGEMYKSYFHINTE